MQQAPFTFLALGDSYTIGESVDQNQGWPVQLVERLNSKAIEIVEPQIIAKTGWTTDELQLAIEGANIAETFDLVSLLIGVNNQYRGYTIDQYRQEFAALLNQAIQFADGNSENVFVVSIPDYGVTPFVAEKGLDPVKIAKELDEYNRIAREICLSKQVSFTDITQGSRRAAEDADLVAADGLHPSGKMYADWVSSLYPYVYDNLSSR